MNQLLLFFWFWAVFLAGAQLPRVSIKVLPSVLMAGGTLRVECYVAHHADNRALEFGVRDVRVSTEQLDGEVAPVLYSMMIQDVPCLPDQAVVPYCLLTDKHNDQYRATRFVQVTGCGPEDAQLDSNDKR